MRQPTSDSRLEKIRASLPIAERKVFDMMLARSVEEIHRCFHLTATGAALVLKAVREVEDGEKS
jgi:hypothetical protein